MNSNRTRSELKIVLAAAAALFGAGDPLLAADADDEITALTEPDSEVRVGVGYVDTDNFRFGQYTGLNDKGTYALIELDLIQRNDDTGTWFVVSGRDLGLDRREVQLDYDRQGDWRYFAEFSEIPRFNPYTHSTGFAGIGTPNATVNGTPLRDVELETERTRIAAGAQKWFGNFSFEVRARDEQKEGGRMFGRGTPGAMEFLAEPIDQRMRQLEATLDYAGRQLHVSGGYYGTAFDNESAGINIVGGAAALAGAAVPFTPIALAPDNQSHQLFLSGGYRFTPTSAGNFKLAYGRATQDDAFVVPSTTGRTDLGGRIDTALLQLGFSARPLPALSLLANLRYEDRDDKTPVVDYFPVTVTTTATGENEPRDIETFAGKLEASYYLPGGFRLTAGFEDEIKRRNTSRVRVVSFRSRTDEKSYRLELRRSVSQSVTGALAYVRSDRDGSDFQTTTLANETIGSNLIAPIHLADRERDKVRLLVDWTPLEPLSIQLMADYASDEYSGRTPLDLGTRSGRAELYSLDAAYALSDDWQASAWASRNENRIDQATCVAASGTGVCPAGLTNPVWAAQLRNEGDSLGLGLEGKFSHTLAVGADAQYSDIRDKFMQRAITPELASIVPIPDIQTRLTTANVYARYTFPNNSALRFDVIYDLFRTDDWTWSTFTYADGTRVIEDPKQRVYFVGVSYSYRWQ